MPGFDHETFGDESFGDGTFGEKVGVGVSGKKWWVFVGPIRLLNVFEECC